MVVETAQETVTVPAGADSLAAGVKKLVLAVVANHKAAGGAVLVEVSSDVTAAVAALAPALQKAGLIGDEVKADPLGVGEALVLAGVEAAKALTGSPTAS